MFLMLVTQKKRFNHLRLAALFFSKIGQKDPKKAPQPLLKNVDHFWREQFWWYKVK
jgi:hypothetical protein